VKVAKYAWSGRERLGLLRVRDDMTGNPDYQNMRSSS
jgi:hypothetical protein